LSIQKLRLMTQTINSNRGGVGEFLWGNEWRMDIYILLLLAFSHPRGASATCYRIERPTERKGDCPKRNKKFDIN
jgi:hypothetical protein